MIPTDAGPWHQRQIEAASATACRSLVLPDGGLRKGRAGLSGPPVPGRRASGTRGQRVARLPAGAHAVRAHPRRPRLRRRHPTRLQRRQLQRLAAEVAAPGRRARRPDPRIRHRQHPVALAAPRGSSCSRYRYAAGLAAAPRGTDARTGRSRSRRAPRTPATRDPARSSWGYLREKAPGAETSQSDDQVSVRWRTHQRVAAEIAGPSRGAQRMTSRPGAPHLRATPNETEDHSASPGRAFR